MRLVSLCPSITQLLFDLGVGSNLVAITRFCIHPANAVKNIKKIGGTKDPKIEEIIALRPDLVFLNREENRKEDAELLQAAGLSCHSSMPVSLEDTQANLLDTGKVLGQKQRAQELVAAIQRARTEVADCARGQSFAYLIWRKPWMAISKNCYIHHLLAETGAVNVFAEESPTYFQMTCEQLAAAQPDRILLSSEPFPFKQKHIEELASKTGLPAKRFVLVDGELLSWHGCFTRQGLFHARDILTFGDDAS